MAAEDTNVIELHPQAVARFRENIENLASIIGAGGTPDDDVSASFRELVAAVVVAPRSKGEQYTVQIQGFLSSLLPEGVSAIKMVAEEGVEPPTPGL